MLISTRRGPPIVGSKFIRSEQQTPLSLQAMYHPQNSRRAGQRKANNATTASYSIAGYHLRNPRPPVKQSLGVSAEYQTQQA